MNNDNGSLNYSVSLNIEELKRGAEQSMAYLRKIGATAEQEGNAMDATFKKLSVAAAGVFAADKIKDFTLNVAKVRGEFQKLEIAFSTMLGSQEKANALMSQLTETAAITPFGMSDVANGAKQLLAYGLEADKVNETLIRLGDIAAGLSIPLNDLAYLYGTTMVQGRMYTQDLNQFLGRGIPIMDELAAQFGVAKEQVKDLVTEGKVGFPEVEKAIISLTSEGSKFGGLMEAQSKTITGQWSNIEDSIEQMMNELGKSSEGVINTAMNAVSTVVENWKSIGKAILVVVAAYGTYKAAVLAVAAAHKLAAIWGQVQAFLSLTKSVTSAKDAMLLLNLATKANPVGLVLSVVAAATTAMWAFSKSTSSAAGESKALAEATRQYNEETAKEQLKIDTLFQKLRSAKKGTEEYKTAKEQILSQYGEYLKGLDKEIASLDNVEGAYKAVAAAARDAAKARAMEKVVTEAADTYVKETVDAEEVAKKTLEKKYGSTKAANGELLSTTKLRELKTAIANGQKISEDFINSFAEEHTYTMQSTAGAYTTTTTVNDMRAAVKQMQGAKRDYEETVRDAEETLGALVGEKTTASKTTTTSTSSKSSGGGSGKSAAEVAAERQKANLAVTEAEKKAAEERAKALLDLEEQLTTQRLTLMGEGAEKERQQLDLSQQKEREQLEEQKKSAVQAEIERQKAIFEAGEEAKKAQNKNYTKQNFTDANIDQAQIDKIKKKYGELATGLADTQQKAQADLERKIVQDELTAMKEYLNEYGSFQEQKLAIAAEYAEKIREVQASSDSEESKGRKIMTLKAQQATAENEVEAKAISARIDWYTVFGNVGGILKDVLRPLLDELKTYVGTDAFKSLGADQQKAIVDAMSTIRDQIGTNGDLGWRDLARDLTAYQTALQEVSAATKEYEAKQAELTPKIEEARKAIDKATQKKDADGLKAAQEQLTEILNELAESGAKVTSANKNVTSSGQKLAQSSKDVTQPIDSIHNFLQGTGLSELQTVWDSLMQIKGAADGLKALKNIGEDVQDLGKDLGDAGKNAADAGKDIGKNLGDALSKGGLITQIVGAVLKICDVLKEGIGTVISSVIDSVTSAVSGILENLLSGDMFKQIGTSLYSGVTGIFDSLIGGLGHIFSGGTLSSSMSDWFTNSNAAAVAKTTEELTNRNELLQYSIEKLTESIDDAYGTQALKAYEEAKKAEEEKIANLQKILNAQQGYHAAHRSNAYYWDMSAADTAAVNALLGTSLVGNQWSGWGQLTPEQMEQIRTMLPSVWSAMMEQGKYDKSEYFENYADEAGKLKELTEQINENLTTTTFENLRDDFISNLMDMEKSAEDFANDFSKMMQEALLQAAIGNKFDEKIKKWYADLTDKMKNEDGTYREMTKDEIDDFRERWNALTAEGIAERDRLLSITGYTGDSSSREATTTGIANASQESVDELNGRATAIQGHTYSINEQTKLLVANTNTILNSVLSIEKHTETIANDVKNVRSAVSDMTTKGVKIKA